MIQADIRQGLPFLPQQFQDIIANLSLHYFPWEQTCHILTQIRSSLQKRYASLPKNIMVNIPFATTGLIDMIKRTAIPLILIFLLLTACVGGQNIPKSTPTTSQILTKPTSTPTPMGTWETIIDGVIYDAAIGPAKPIMNASVHYDVTGTYFASLQTDRPNQTKTDEKGQFSLSVIVHDTDSIRLVVTAPEFTPYEEKLVGIDLVGGKSFSIGLTREVTETIDSP